MNLAYAAQLVKESATIVDAADWFGYDYDEEGRHECPTCRDNSTTKQTLALFDEDTRFYCFRCNEGGDVIDWIAAELRMGKGQAINYLATRLGLSMDRSMMPEAVRSIFKKKTKTLRARAHKRRVLHEVRRAFWKTSRGGIQLMEESEQRRIIAHYLDAETLVAKRPDIAPKIMQRLGRPDDAFFDEGYARQSELQARYVESRREKVFEFVASRNWPKAVVDKYGIGIGTKPQVEDIDEALGNLSRQSRWLHRNRITFPILTPDGRVAGWTSRTLDDRQAKWINNRNGQTYNKQRTLFGLGNHASRISKDDFAIIVEGAGDAIAVASLARLPYTVSACGTSFNEEHAELLARFTNRAIIITDGDDAGEASAGKAASALRTWGIKSQRITLPEGEDPDSYAQGHAGALVKAVKVALGRFDSKHKTPARPEVSAAVSRILNQ